MIAFVPGSFDPITNGHLDIIERAAKIYDRVIVCPGKNSSKTAMFSLDERMDMINKATVNFSNVEVQAYSGALATYVDSFPEKKIIVKGLRTVSDFEYEQQMAYLNREIRQSAETSFMQASPQFSFLSSSAVKEVARLGEDITRMVPIHVAEAVWARLAQIAYQSNMS